MLTKTVEPVWGPAFYYLFITYLFITSFSQMLEGCDIRGTLHDNFRGFFGFLFFRKLAHMKLYGTDKASKHNGRTIFSKFWSGLRTNEQEWCQRSCIVFLSSF